MALLKERQFYNVATRKREMVLAVYIEIVKFKNGSFALLGISRDNDKMFKLIPESKVEKLKKKYGNVRKYKKSKK